MTGSFLDRLVEFTFTQSASPSAVTNATTSNQTFTVNGLKTTDFIFDVSKPTNQSGLIIAGYQVSAANTLQVTYGNLSASPITPTASEVYTVVAYRADRKVQVGSVQFN